MSALAEHGRQSIERGSTSFSAASKLFSRTMREDVWALYAWCRRCDDLIDGQDHGSAAQQLSPEERYRRLQMLREMTSAALSGQPVDDPAFQGLQMVAARRRLSGRWPIEHLNGFAFDVAGGTCRHTRDLLEYCWGVAGVVGVMMATIMGVRDPRVLQRAQDLGIAFQLTNICRDVLEDAQAGRVYLPHDLLRAAGAGTTPQALAKSDDLSAEFAVVKELLTVAEEYYASSRRGLRDLPFRAALAVAAARDIYRQIGRRILARGPQAMRSRMRVPRWLMVLLVLRGGAVAVWSRVERLYETEERPALWSRI